MRNGPMILLVVAACTEAPDDRDLLARIREDGYRDWARPPGWDAPLSPAAGGPHGSFLDLYVNDVMQDAITAGTAMTEWPEGSIVAKDAYTDDAGENLRFIALMEKEDGKWFWAEYRDDDAVVAAGLEEPTCTGCHDAGADGVLAFTFPQ